MQIQIVSYKHLIALVNSECGMIVTVVYCIILQPLLTGTSDPQQRGSLNTETFAHS